MTDHSDLLQPAAELEAGIAESGFSVGFGNQCNAYVDVIQQALDLALGNTGNLAPDTAVVDALDELYITARNAGATALLQLLVPLNQVLRSAEQSGFTLSQADTLLVQEAIIAITLGIDSIVNNKPTPGLLSDVTQRMIDVAAENKHEIRANSEATGLVNIFVSDADELLQRLFEQIQRWRASAFVGRGYEEVNRLLLQLRDGADSAGLSGMASVVHLLLERMSAQRIAEAVPDDDFFDLAIDTIEILGDDLDRIRNNEQLIDHTELCERLAVEGADPKASIAAYRAEPRENVASRDPSDALAATHASQADTSAARVETVDRSTVANAAAVPEPAKVSEAEVTEVTDVSLLDNVSTGYWPDHRELVDVLREISRGNEAIKERIEQLRRTIHVYPDARQVTIDTDTELGSAISAVDNIFFKIDSLISKQRKSVTSMASVLGVEEQQTVRALGAELIKHPALSELDVEYRKGADRVVINSQLYDHLAYTLKIMLDSVVPWSDTRATDNDAGDNEADVRVIFDLAIDQGAEHSADQSPYQSSIRSIDQLIVKIVGEQLRVSEFVVANACLRAVDEQMLRTQLPRATFEMGVTHDVSAPYGNNAATMVTAGEGHNTAGKDADLITLAALQRLIDIAAYFQGRVTSSFKWNERGNVGCGAIEMVLPVAAMSEEVVLVKSGGRLYGVPSVVIEKMEGIDSQRVTPADGVLIRCRRSRGGHCTVRVDAVMGKQTVSVTKNPWLMLGDAYSGAFVFSDSSLVLVINTESLEPGAQLELLG